MALPSRSYRRNQTLPALAVTTTGLTVEDLKKTQRKQRRPTHPFLLKYRPFEIQPFLLAPVLPGETMTNLLLQARCVTDPITSKLIGWWNEYYFFYVKLRDLQERDAIVNTLLTNDPMIGESGYGDYAAGDMERQSFFNSAGYNFADACLEVVVEHYFRDEDELDSGAAIWGNSDALSVDGKPIAKINLSNALQSLVLDTDTPIAENEELPGEGFPALPAHLSAFSDHFAQWKDMFAMNMTEATFEDWLRQYGVKAPAEEREIIHIPELIRYVRDFSYPSNAVNPADGSVASAVSWSISERADKDRFCSEPGFIFGVTVARPKVYLGKQTGAVANMLNTAYSWLPAILQNDPFTSLVKFDNDDMAALRGPIEDMPADYWLDVRDLFMYGEQFVNFEVTTATDANKATLPVASAYAPVALNKSYMPDADVAALFVDPVNAPYVRCDGRVDLSILTRLEDTSPASPA